MTGKAQGIDALELTPVKIQEFETGENGIITVLIPDSNGVLFTIIW
ncbi:MAG: hypothetical protein IPG53_17480 [Ignavibacteriales bacterium]|nr:hypothetical protein [Ignavibacteriales bacterium]